MPTLFPEWLELVRLAGTFLIWAIFPLQLWSIHRQYLQHQRWDVGERARMERWAQDMDAAGRLREEAHQLRIQAEVALAMARQQAANKSQ